MREKNANSNLPRFAFWDTTTEDLYNGNLELRVLEPLGSGYGGTVLKCVTSQEQNKNKNNDRHRVVAIKIMCKKKTKSRVARNEVNLLNLAQGPNVVQFLSATECLDSYWITTEFCMFGDLHGILRDLDDGHVMARNYLNGVLSGLESLHNKLIAHQDIKMKNILISDQNVAKLADFGFAKQYESEEDKETSCNGTKDYWAPEMLVSTPLFNPFKTDIYALGVTFVGVCEKRPIKRKYENVSYVVNQLKNSHQMSLFRGMLNSNVKARWTFNQIRENIWLNECLAVSESPRQHINNAAQWSHESD